MRQRAACPGDLALPGERHGDGGVDQRRWNAVLLEIGDDAEAASAARTELRGPVGREAGVVDPAQLCAPRDGRGGRGRLIAELGQMLLQLGRRARRAREDARRDVERTDGPRTGRP
jgi:hypothetical protein